MSEKKQPESGEEGSDSETAGSREGEAMDEAHRETPGEGASPDPGHPYPGEGVGMPDRGAGRAKMDSTQPIGTEDQGDVSESSAEKKGLRGGEKQE